jgi:DmsE family decaheme c-type cytochrome
MKEIIMDLRRYLTIMVVVLAVLVSFVSFSSFGQEKKVQTEGYVGSETCKDCHSDLYDVFKKDPHWNKGCEGCHGPGGKHAEAEGKGLIFSFKDKNTSEKSGACLKCHQKQKELFQFRRGVHQLSAVGCNDCHQIHAMQVTQSLLKSKDPDLCFSCHGEVKSKFYLPNNHRVIQGAVKCSDCHTPHGSRNRASLRKINKFDTDVCYKCHPEKRGPWVFEHQAQKFEGCSICHSPHGSPNRFLLIRRDVRSLCMECHGQVHFPKFSCINCHNQIHGSNFSSRFLQ